MKDDTAEDAKKDNTTEDANYFTEEGIEESTENLMRKLEAAKDPDTYRQRFHRRKPSASRAARSSHPATRGVTMTASSLFVTVLAIIVGAAAGILLSMYVI